MNARLECAGFAVSIAWLAASLQGCGGGDPAEAEVGEALYLGAQSAALGSPGNEADCALCHSDDGTQSGYPGETLMDIAFLDSYKGGDAPDLRAAVNACVTGWMGGEALAEDDVEWQSLRGYLESISDPSIATPRALTPEVLEDEAAYEVAYAGGDAAAGEAKFEAHCGSCHGTGLQVGPVKSFPTNTLSTRGIGRIAQKVRTSGPPPSGTADASDTTPGPMPFFEPDDLSVEDLKDIIAFLEG